MANPSRHAFQSLPILSMSRWDRVPDVDGAVDALDLGYFRQAALLCDAMMRDDRIAGVMGTRVGALMAAAVDVKPADDKAKSQRIADQLGGSDSAPGEWSKMFPKSAIGDLIRWGNMVGIGVAQIVWDGSPKAWTPRLIPWHPQFLRFDWQTMTYRLQVAFEAEVVLPRVDQVAQSDGNWLIWAPHGYYYGWLKAMVRYLARKYIMRGWDERDWARYNEVHGSPITEALVPTGGEAREKNAFFNQVANRGAESTVMVPVGPDGMEKRQWGVNLVEATARTFESFQTFGEKLDVDIAVAILGQNLTTEVQGGSKAAAQEHTLVRIDKAKEDAQLADCLREQVLTHWAMWNFGDPGLAPRPSFVVEPPENETEEGAAYKALGDGIASLQLATGDAIDFRAILDQHGIPMLTAEELAAQRADKAAEAAKLAQEHPMPPPPGAPGAGGAGGPGKPPVGGGKPPAPGEKKQPPETAQMGSRYVQVPPVARYEFQGLPIAVENPKGSTRLWTDSDGTVGQTQMQADYGYIDGHMGSDGEELDCYVGGDETATDVHVIHQLKAPDFTAHDEDKTMIGYPDAGAAKAGYLAHRNDGDRSFGGMSTIPLDRFKSKLQRRTSTGKIRARANLDGIVAAASGLLERAETQKRSSAALGSKGRHRAKLYGDRVADRAIKLAAGAMGPALASIREEIDAATSYPDLKRRILARYKDMDAADVADLVYRARVMARIGGQASAVKRL